MGDVVLSDRSGQDLARTYFGESAGNHVPGVFANDGTITNSEVNEALYALEERINSEGMRCSGPWDWDRFGREIFPCVQPNRLVSTEPMTEAHGMRELRHVRLTIREEGQRPTWGIFRERFTVTRNVDLTIQWNRDGHISLYREDIPGNVPPLTPPPPPPPPQPDPLGDAVASAYHGVANFFSDAATAISSNANSLANSVRRFFA